MTHKLIKTDNYLLVVDDSEIKVGDNCLCDIPAGDYFGVVAYNGAFAEHLKAIWLKIISHLPLNSSPILEGVDLLPPIEDDVEEAERVFTEVLDSETKQVYNKMLLDATEHGFIIGYNKAREKYKYTEEDIRKAITMARDLEDWQDLVWEYEYDDIIQSLHQYPTEFECEMEWVRDKPYDEVYKVAKTITTAQGVQWVGKYK